MTVVCFTYACIRVPTVRRHPMNVLKERLLSLPLGYLAVQWILGGERARIVHLRRSLRPRAADRVLDIGCGPAAILRHLPPTVRYTGVDVDAPYIAHARRTFGDREPLCWLPPMA